jgi:hypothetical protein
LSTQFTEAFYSLFENENVYDEKSLEGEEKNDGRILFVFILISVNWIVVCVFLLISSWYISYYLSFLLILNFCLSCFVEKINFHETQISPFILFWLFYIVNLTFFDLIILWNDKRLFQNLKNFPMFLTSLTFIDRKKDWILNTHTLFMKLPIEKVPLQTVLIEHSL